MKNRKLVIVGVILLATLLSVFLLNGYISKKKTPVFNEQEKNHVQKQSELQTTEPPTPEFDLFKGDERAVAVMIDNEGIATQRHAGLEKAYVVYEMVVEGGDSRLMAVFKGTNPEVIGPVRSSRHYFIHYALEHDPIYVHYGWSPLAERTIAELKVNNINGIMGLDGTIFWRNPKRPGDWHNAFTSMEKIKKMIARKKYRDKSDVEVFKYSLSEVDLAGGSKAEEIRIPYSGYRITNYKYDSTNKIYKRYLGNKPHTDSITKQQYSAKNVIIQFVKNYPLNDGTKAGRQQMDTVGEGQGYFITNGRAIEITWEKNTRTAKTIYKDKNGNEITLNKGQTWIQIVPVYSKISIK